MRKKTKSCQAVGVCALKELQDIYYAFAELRGGGSPRKRSKRISPQSHLLARTATTMCTPWQASQRRAEKKVEYMCASRTSAFLYARAELFPNILFSSAQQCSRRHLPVD